MKPMKTGGWLQGLYEISATAREEVGTLRRDLYGNAYRYAKAGGTALSPGKATTSPAANADWQDIAVAAAVAVGGKQVTLTNTAVGVDTLAADYFKGGQLQINDAAGEGHWYRIVSSTALTAASTAVTVTLDEGIRVALTTSSEGTLVPNPYMGVVVSSTETLQPTGTPLVDVTAEYYYWSQTGGEGVYWAHDDVAAIGSYLVNDAADGELSPWVLDLDATADADVVVSPVAIAIQRATPVDTEYCPCRWIID